MKSADSSAAKIEELVIDELALADDESSETSTSTTGSRITETAAWLAVVVAALGYFVDVFDMWLFSNYRVASLTELGLVGEQLTLQGVRLLNYQLAGFLIGGFLWGILGDKRGRASVMFGSIFLYSTATLLNAFVTNVDQYAALRLMSGLGLAGEIGAGITLVAELLPKNKRGWGTMLVTSFGVAGAIGAALCAKLIDWKTAYIAGGLMGFALLILRVLVHESGMFGKACESKVKRGSLLTLFGNWRRTMRYLACIFIGIPIYVTFGLFATFSPEIAASLGITEKVSVPDVMLWASIGITVGDVLAGTLSQLFKSRKKPIYAFLIVGLLSTLLLGFGGVVTTALQYGILTGIIGTCCGFWACLITATAEQFGTNIRATATTSVPNLVRGSGIILTLGFTYFKGMGIEAAAAATLIACLSYALSLIALLTIKETYHRDLDFMEE